MAQATQASDIPNRVVARGMGSVLMKKRTGVLETTMRAPEFQGRVQEVHAELLIEKEELNLHDRMVEVNWTRANGMTTEAAREKFQQAVIERLGGVS
jgi:hypothetical protein